MWRLLEEIVTSHWTRISQKSRVRITSLNLHYRLQELSTEFGGVVSRAKVWIKVCNVQFQETGMDWQLPRLLPPRETFRLRSLARFSCHFFASARLWPSTPIRPKSKWLLATHKWWPKRLYSKAMICMDSKTGRSKQQMIPCSHWTSKSCWWPENRLWRE